eukprot:15364584-Ditylum_brightwellii.AAC.1
MSYLMTSKLGLESIEETNHTEERRKLFFLYCKHNAKNVHHFVDNMLANIFDECILKENRHKQVSTPGGARASMTNFIDLYVDALKKLAKPTSNNPQDDNTISTNLAPARLRKQVATALLMDEFPHFSKQQGKHSTQEEITVESTIASQQTADITAMESHLTEKINALSAKMNHQMEQMSTDMKKMGNDIRSEMTKVINNLTTSAITKVDNHMSTQFESMSNNVSTIIAQMNQASTNMVKVFNNATQQHSYPRHPT